ncbi:MAG: acylphosphatase [Alphaproteobacteria bacterium]
MTDRQAWLLRIAGRVQGVGFRAWIVREAVRRELDGWVRNRRDGTVEALFAGPAAAVAAMIEACRRGPIGARVDRVETGEPAAADVPARGRGFAQRPTE